MNVYKTVGTCSTQIFFNVDEEKKVHDVKFIGGCRGNLQGVSRLVENRPIDEVVSLLKGINCRAGTSCPDQLATALIQYKEKNGL